MQGFGGEQQVYGNGGGEIKDEDQPWYVKYGIRALGTFAGGLCLFLGAMNVIFSVFSPVCMLFAIWQMLVGFLVVTIEAPFCCAFVDHVQVFARKIEDRPLLVKAAVYVVAPLPTIIFCFGFYSFIGGGVVIGAGVIYAMIALGKKASREEMARNAQQQSSIGGVGGGSGSSGITGSTSAYQQEPVKNPFSTINISRDPIAAAAAEWANHSASKFEPPPSYNSALSNNQQPPRQTWDQSFVNENSRPAASSFGANPAPSDPNNPFR